MSSCIEYPTRIQLLIDGELIGDEQEDLRQHLENCPECQKVLEELEAESRRIRAARPRIAAPESLRSTILRHLQTNNEQGKTEEATAAASPKVVAMPARRFGRASIAVAATVLLVAGGIFTYNRRNEQNANALIQEAILTHQAVQSNAMPLDISSSAPQQVIDYFQRKISFPLRYANTGIASDDLAKYTLTGGRLISVGNERAVLLSFILSNEHITMIVAPGEIAVPAFGSEFHSDGITFHGHDRDSLHVVTWKNRGLSYALTSTRAMTSTGKCSTCHEERPSTTASTGNNMLRWLSLSRDHM